MRGKQRGEGGGEQTKKERTSRETPQNGNRKDGGQRENTTRDGTKSRATGSGREREQRSTSSQGGGSGAQVRHGREGRGTRRGNQRRNSTKRGKEARCKGGERAGEPSSKEQDGRRQSANKEGQRQTKEEATSPGTPTGAVGCKNTGQQGQGTCEAQRKRKKGARDSGDRRRGVPRARESKASRSQRRRATRKLGTIDGEPTFKHAERSEENRLARPVKHRNASRKGGGSQAEEEGQSPAPKSPKHKLAGQQTGRRSGEGQKETRKRKPRRG